MSTLIQFSRNIRKLGSRIENNSVVLVRRVARRVLRDLIAGTPADTGRARSNWRVSNTNRTFAVIPPYAPGRNLGRGETANASAARNAGYEVIKAHRKNQALYITNNIGYLNKLRNGASVQQSSDWVGDAVFNAQAEIATIKLTERTLVE